MDSLGLPPKARRTVEISAPLLTLLLALVAALGVSTVTLSTRAYFAPAAPSAPVEVDHRRSIVPRPSAMPHFVDCPKADLLNETMRAVWPANRAHLISNMRDIPRGLLYLEGSTVLSTGNSDAHYPFIQDSYFQYLSGVDLPDCLFFVDLESSNSTLFLSRVDPVWAGRDYSLEYWALKYSVTVVYQRSSQSLREFFSKFDDTVILFASSGSQVPQEWTGEVDREVLPQKLRESRLIKTPEEIALMRLIADISADAHTGLMKEMKQLRSEYASEALFLDNIYSCMLDSTGYSPIVGHGYNSAILHYTTNEDKFTDKGEWILVDAAGSFRYYTGDITRTYPTSGVFTPIQAGVYNAVLTAQRAAEAQCRPGASTAAMLDASRRALFAALQDLGFIQADAAYNGAALALFLPHGISHTLGLDVHDDAPMPAILQTGVVFTIEPGTYFNQAIFTEAAYARNPIVIRSTVEPLVAAEFGGVRIEDDYVVTEDGCECISCGAPRDVDEIESVMNGGAFARVKSD